MGKRQVEEIGRTLFEASQKLLGATLALEAMGEVDMAMHERLGLLGQLLSFGCVNELNQNKEPRADRTFKPRMTASLGADFHVFESTIVAPACATTTT